MNAQQKRAWLILVVAVATLVGYIVLGLTINFQIAFAALGIFGLAAFAGLIGRGEKQDERDQAINRRAALVAGVASYLAFVLGCMGVWFVTYLGQGQGEVSVHVLPQITMLCGIVLNVAWCVGILVLYGRRVESEQG